MNIYLFLGNKGLRILIKIVKITISRFRSILNLDIPISNENNMIAICGKNNVGKTNTLRAINLFFNPNDFEQEIDIPRIKHATGGQSVYPKIEITFYDSEEDIYYAITRDLKNYSEENDGLSGISFQYSGKRKVNKKNKQIEELKKFLGKIKFTYIESINTFIPELISNLTEDMINIQYNKTKFTESKRALKDSYEAYVNGLQEILNSFSEEISETFKSFQEQWCVQFNVPKKSETFRELISDDVTLTLNDKGSDGIIDKGAGLQRLATILLTFEMLSRMKKTKQMIVCIDEPDAYMHEGLQRKLKNFFDEKSNDVQLFFTTHSKVFINPYNMENVNLLDARVYDKYSTRKKKNISVIESVKVDIDTEEGYNQICNHLGIERVCYDVLQRNNILVEGSCDKKYITELGKFFNLDIPNIESLNGTDNAKKYLDFYNSYYQNNPLQYKPRIKVFLDNDQKGRNVFQQIKPSQYRNIDVKCLLSNNFCMTSNMNISNNSTNNEIEDLLYPELICFLVNEILSKKNMININSNKICKNIKKAAFASKGILDLCEHEKNSVNPDRGIEVCFVSSGDATIRIKEGMANLFNVQANHKLQRLLRECEIKYPHVKQEITKLLNFDDYQEE